MPLDPSIVSNAFANISMPDMNALMNQRVRGAENIYQIETGRQEQAAQTEKEAAKAQEDAAFKALLPAYTYGIQTGDIAGAGNLVPPELRPQLQQYIDALTGKSPQEVQAALIGSLSSDPRGQEALSAIQRGQTFGVQQGQLDVSRERLAFDRKKTLAEAAGGGKVASSEVDAQGNKHFFDAYGNEIRVAQGVGKPAAATDTNGVKLKPDQRLKEDGTVELIPGSTTYNKQKSDFANDYKSAKASLQAINNLKTKVDTLAKTTGFQKTMNTGAYMTAIPNTPLASLTGAYDFQNKFDDVVSAVTTFGREIASMSGKLGNMAAQEWENVAGSVANMVPSKMSSADLDRQLNSIATQLAIAENNVRNAYELEYGGGQFYSPLENQGQTKTQGGGETRPAGVGPDWTHMTDTNGVSAWVSPDQKQIIEAQ